MSAVIGWTDYDDNDDCIIPSSDNQSKKHSLKEYFIKFDSGDSGDSGLGSDVDSCNSGVDLDVD